MSLFSVECMTCRRRLKVKSTEAIGQILACPGCGSMVEVVPPADFQPPAPDAAAADGAGPQQAANHLATWSDGDDPEPGESAARMADTLDDLDVVSDSGVPDLGVLDSEVWNSNVLDSNVLNSNVLNSDISNNDAWDDGPAAPAGKRPSLDQPLASNVWASPAEQLLKKRLLLAGSAVALLAIVTVLTVFALSGGKDDPTESSRVDAKDDSSEDAANPATDEKTEKTTAESAAPKPADPVDPPSDVEPVDPTDPPSDPLPPNPDPPPENTDEPKTDLPKTDEPMIDPPPAPPVNPVDVEARLADMVPAVDFQQIGLSEFVEFLSDMSTVAITLDLDALAELRLGLDTPLKVTKSNATVSDVLRAALAPKLDYVIRDGQVVVTRAAADGDVRTVKHFVGDLATNEAERKALAGVVRKMIEPTTWTGELPEGKIEFSQDRLVVTHRFAAHYKILRLLERLRAARSIPRHSTHYPASVFELKSPLAQARDRLAAPLPANFHQTPLKEIVTHVNGISDLRVVVDWHALGQAGVWPDTPATLRAQPTLAALGEMLTALRLGLRVVDGHTVQITSMAALTERYDVQLHRIGHLLPRPAAAAPFIDNIKSRVAPQSWQAAGGSGTMHYDAVSGYLIVRQTQGVQNLLETAFEGLQKEER